MTLDLKIPPLLLTVLFSLLMRVLALIAPQQIFLLPRQNLLVFISIITGLFFVAAGVFSFRRAKTTVNPTTPNATTSLQTTGIYNISRNPMYVGFFCLLFGWGIFLGNSYAMLLVIGFIFYLNHFQIRHEEQALVGLFGEQYLCYKKRVRRWL